MIKVLIIDDEPLARSLIVEYLADYETIKVVGESGDGFEGLKAIHLFRPDLIFLDIQMPKISGFEMLELLDNPPAVIFTTAFDEFAIKAFESNAIDYLLKPFSKDRFNKAVNKWLNQNRQSPSDEKRELGEGPIMIRPEERNRVVVKTSHGIKIIPLPEIFYIEAYDDYVKIHTREGYFLKKKTLSYYEQALTNTDFIRVHRSFMVAIAQITRIENPEKETHVALLKSGIRIPLSRTGYTKLKSALGL